MARWNLLSARKVDGIKQDGVHADGARLYLRVRGNSRSWIFIYHLDGKRREMGLGALPGVSLARARERAQEARELIAAGLDPLAARQTAKHTPNFGSFADTWIADREGTVRSDKSIARWRRLLGDEGPAASLRKLRIDRVGTNDVLAALRPIWGNGKSSTLARGYIESVLDSARAQGLRSGENPARWRGHLDQVLPKPVKMARGHHKAMPYADVPAFIARLRERPAAAARLLEFIILTAARSGEAIGATWSEIDLEARVWTVPATRMKAGREHRVALSGRAVSILEALGSQTARAEACVFGTETHPPSNMAAPMLLRRMGSDVTVHGFRSSFRDFAGDETSFSREIAEAALAHTLNDVEAAYRRGDALAKRGQLMEAWAKYCASAPSK